MTSNTSASSLGAQVNSIQILLELSFSIRVDEKPARSCRVPSWTIRESSRVFRTSESEEALRPTTMFTEHRSAYQPTIIFIEASSTYQLLLRRLWRKHLFYDLLIEYSRCISGQKRLRSRFLLIPSWWHQLVPTYHHFLSASFVRIGDLCRLSDYSVVEQACQRGSIVYSEIQWMYKSETRFNLLNTTAALSKSDREQPFDRLFGIAYLE